MKLYRVLANSFLSKNRLDETNPTGLEGIYYNMGYTSFSGEKNFHRCNNIYKSINEVGKFFFLFFEDALNYGTGLLNGTHNLNIQSYTIATYDIPVDIILKNIGYGDYSDSILRELAIETFINKSDIIGSRISSQNISDEEKKKAILNYFKYTLNELENLKDFSIFDYIYYLKQFNDNLKEVLKSPKIIDEILKNNDLTEVLKNPEIREEKLKNSDLFKIYLSSNRELIQCPFITRRSIVVNKCYLYDKFLFFKNPEPIKEYYGKQNICCDFSKEQKSFKNELLYYVENQKEPEEIKRLLKSRNYIK